MTTFVVLRWAREPWAEVVWHVVCADCKQPYTDSSRTSKRCAECRKKHKRVRVETKAA